MHVLLDPIGLGDVRGAVRIQAVEQCDVSQILSLASGNRTAVSGR